MKTCYPKEIVLCFDKEELKGEDKYFNKLYEMCKKYKNYCNTMDNKNIEQITVNLEKVKSVLKYIENSLDDEFNYDRADVMNLVSVISDLVDSIQAKLVEIE